MTFAKVTQGHSSTYDEAQWMIVRPCMGQSRTFSEIQVRESRIVRRAFDAAVEAVVVGIFSSAVSTEKTRIMGLPYTGVANFGNVYNLATQYPSETNGQNSYCRR